MSMLWGPQDPPEYIRQLFHSEYPDEAVDYRDYLFPGIPDLLDQLKAQGYTLDTGFLIQEESNSQNVERK